MMKEDRRKYLDTEWNDDSKYGFMKFMEVDVKKTLVEVHLDFQDYHNNGRYSSIHFPKLI